MLLRAQCPSCPCIFWVPGKGRQQLFTLPWTTLSLFWLLIWGIVHTSKNIKGARAAYPGIESMLIAWSGDVTHNRSKLSTAEDIWSDAVFGDLIWKWLDTFQQAHQENKQVTTDMSTVHLGRQEWNETCGKLELYFKDIYKKVLESEFRYLEGVREYSDWDKVVAANAYRSVRVQRYLWAVGV
jgi:hypothetical protein